MLCRRALIALAAGVVLASSGGLAGAATSPAAAPHAAAHLATEGPDPGYPGLSSRPPSAGGTYRANPHLGAGQYPWAHQANPDAPDPYGYAERQCVSYAAWWLNENGVKFSIRTRGPRGIGDFLDADTWPAAAAYAGWATSKTPRVGSIAEWNANESSHWTIGRTHYTMTAGSDGHVAVVVALRSNGLVEMAMYNGNGNRTYSLIDGVAPRYIYIGNS
jgi:surface antigen